MDDFRVWRKEVRIISISMWIYVFSVCFNDPFGSICFASVWRRFKKKSPVHILFKKRKRPTSIDWPSFISRMTVQQQNTRSYAQTCMKISWFQDIFNDLSKTSWWSAIVLHMRKETVRNTETFLQVERHLWNIYVINGNIKHIRKCIRIRWCAWIRRWVYEQKIIKIRPPLHYEFLTKRIR